MPAPMFQAAAAQRSLLGRVWSSVARLWRGSTTLPARTARAGILERLKQFGPWDFLSSLRRNRALSPDFTEQAAIQKGLRESVWANACATKTASAIGSARWWIERQTGTEKWERVRPEDHPAAELVAEPNSEWGWGYLIERQALHLQLAGNGLLDITRRPDGTPVALQEMNPAHVKPVPATRADKTDRYVKQYEYTRSGSKLIIKTDNVIHMQLPDPDNVYWGMGRLEAAQRVIDVDVEAQKSQKYGLENLFVPPGFFTLTGVDDRPLPKDLASDIKDDFTETYLGASKAKKPPFFSANMRFTRLSDTPKDMDFIRGREMSSEEICAAFWTPPPIAGILRKAIYNNITTLRAAWWEDVIVPYLDAISEWYNINFIRREWPDDRIRLVYSTMGIPALRPVITEKIEQAQALVDLGWSLAEAEVFVGLVRPKL